MKKCILLVVIVFCCLSVSGQEKTSIGERILNYRDSKEDYIEKGRRLLMRKFENMELDSVKLVMNYLEDHINDQTYLSFLPAERILLYYWTKQYERLTAFIPDIDQEGKYGYVPDSHMVEGMLTKWSVQDYSTLNQWINESESGEEDQDFLKLLLKMMLADHLLPKIPQQELNDESDAFIARYPDSRYHHFIKTHISVKMATINWGFRMGMRGGYTFHHNDYLNPKGSIDINAGVRYRRWILDVIFAGGFGKLSRDIPDTDWLKGDKASTTHLGFSLGYAVLDNKHFQISPFMGGSLNSSSPNEELRDKYPQLEDVKIKHFSFMAGASIDWKFYQENQMYTPISVYQLSLRISYLPNAFDKAGERYAGDMWFVTMGFSFDISNTKRGY